MKKILFTFVALCSLMFTSCFKESEYTITYTGTNSEDTTITVFEYDGTQFVKKFEIKNVVPNTIYQYTSSDIANQLVIGVVEKIGSNVRIWYASDVFKLDPQKTTHITVNWVDMVTQEFNPINPEDCVSRYLYK